VRLQIKAIRPSLECRVWRSQKAGDTEASIGLKAARNWGFAAEYIMSPGMRGQREGGFKVDASQDLPSPQPSAKSVLTRQPSLGMDPICPVYTNQGPEVGMRGLPRSYSRHPDPNVSGTRLCAVENNFSSSLGRAGQPLLTGAGGGGHWGRKSHKSRLSLLVARPSGGQQGEGGAEMFIQGGGATRIPVTLHLFAGRPQELAVKSQTKALA
jgi:hypothetical protein